jgi:hypothetical protein
MMRRITAVVGVCAVAAASTGVAAGGSAARHFHLASLRLQLIHLLTIERPQLPSIGGGCFVSSASQRCSLIPCTAFVAASGGPDWIPISGPCQRSIGPITTLQTRPQRSPQLSKLLTFLERQQRFPQLSKLYP